MIKYMRLVSDLTEHSPGEKKRGMRRLRRGRGAHHVGVVTLIAALHEGMDDSVATNVTYVQAGMVAWEWIGKGCVE